MGKEGKEEEEDKGMKHEGRRIEKWQKERERGQRKRQQRGRKAQRRKRSISKGGGGDDNLYKWMLAPVHCQKG